jgi:hypothetical protein
VISDKIYADTPDGLAAAAAELRAQRGDDEPAVERDAAMSATELLQARIDEAIAIKDEALNQAVERIREMEALIARYEERHGILSADLTNLTALKRS